MTLHRMNSITIGVPNVEETVAYYADFGLTRETGGWLSTADGGRQLQVEATPTRRLVEISIGTDDPDDLHRISERLGRRGVSVRKDAGSVEAVDPASGVRVTVAVAAPITQQDAPPAPYNGPGAPRRADDRAPAILRSSPVRPRKLGHVVIGCPDQATSEAFFTEGIGLKVSDVVRGQSAFMRCSTDHHNVLVTAAPVNFFHHSSWQVDDVDEIGRGATRMIEGHPERHAWGLGRHHIGSNFFWYLKDPAGNFSEYYSDLDCIVDDAQWTPEVWDGAKGLYSWGPPPPPSFIQPDDLAELMTGAHQPA
jgi:catechol 2,3-dioxygenase-like lactoylglutathione lyase family enzyme